MSDHRDESSAAPIPAILTSVLESLKNLPAASDSYYNPPPSSRLFGRQKPVHEMLGGGLYADMCLWRNKQHSAGFLTGATVIWVLFEWVGCHLVSLLSLLSLIVVVVLFVWSTGAAFLNRPPPPMPRVELSDDLVLNVARNLKVEVNRVLAILHDIAIERDVKLFLKVVVSLWLLSICGGYFHFLTLLYLAIVGAHTLPLIYEKHEDTIESVAERALRELNKQYKKFDETVLSKIPRGPSKEKKSE